MSFCVFAPAAAEINQSGPRLALLNAFELRCEGRLVALPRPAQRLLAFLALQDRPVLRTYVAEGLEHRSPYALRHTFATFAIAAGVSLFELARFMGTSAEQIDKTYGHLLPDALDRTRAALDAFTAAVPAQRRQKTRL